MSALIQIDNLSKEYSGQVVLDEIGFVVNEKQRLGVVGRNGAGKSTLFKIIVGDETADSGEVKIFDNAVIGYLRQEENFLDNETTLEYLLRMSGKEDWQCRKTASQFDLTEVELNTFAKSLSGGYQMRIKLTAMLLSEPNLLMLDEPTNYLDMATMLLLENFLKNYQGAFMIISHDREFLESVCSETLELELGRAVVYPGNLSQYEEYKAKKLTTALNFNKKQDRKAKHLQSFVDRFRYKASKASQAQSKLKAISKIKRVEILERPSDVHIQMPKIDSGHGLAVRVENLSIGYGDKIVAEGIDFDIEKGQHLAILGDNGEGKSTFVKTLAGEIDKLTGEIRWMPNMETAYYAQHVFESMPKKLTIEAYLAREAHQSKSSEEILQMASNFLFKGDDLKKSISVLSGGEKSRLCLAGILLNPKNVLLLDEPNNHLDFATVEALARALHQTEATVLFISHDRTFVNMVADEIIEVGQGKISKFTGDYDDYIEKLKKRVHLGFEEIKNDSNLIVSKEKRRQEFVELKEAKKRLIRLNKQLEENNVKRDEVQAEINKNPTSYDADLYAKLNELNQEIESLENEWIEISEKIS